MLSSSPTPNPPLQGLPNDRCWKDSSTPTLKYSILIRVYHNLPDFTDQVAPGNLKTRNMLTHYFLNFFLCCLCSVSMEGYCCFWTHSVGLLGPTQRPLPDNSQHSEEADIHVPGGIRTRNPSRRATADQRLRPRGHRDRHNSSIHHSQV